MGHRQRGQAPGHGRRLEPPRLAIVNIGDKPRFVGGQADPAALGREARVAIEIDRERLDAGGRPRLDALLEVEFDQAGAFACQLLKQLDELDRAILRGARPPLGQRRLAGCQDRHDLRGNRALGHGQTLCLCSDRQDGFGAHTGGL